MKACRFTISKTLNVLLIALGYVSVPLYMWERHVYTIEREKFQSALVAADAGRWYWNLDQKEIFWDDQMFILFGRVKGDWNPNHGAFEAIIHPEDRDRVNARILKAIEDRGGYQDIFRIVTSSGEVREIRAAAMVSRDGRYMTGINLPAIHRSGNFDSGMNTNRAGSSSHRDGPVPVLPEFDYTTDLEGESETGAMQVSG